MTLRVDVPPSLLHGDVDEGYGPVADTFRRNFAERGEVGAALAVYVDGRLVVDLWGGYRDGRTRRPWEEDTIVLVNSTTKGVASLAVALAHSRGLLDFDRRVAEYWPEFGWRGKQAITVRQLLSHQAGLPILDIPLTVADLADPDLLAAALALQRPLWEPGTRQGYHFITLGWYEGELLRRADPAHRPLGRYFAEEIADPLGLEFYIGVPPEVDLDRRAAIHGRDPVSSLLHLGDMPPSLIVGMLKPHSLMRRAFGNPKELLVDENYNRPDVLAVEIPAGNGIGQPRSVAAAYSAAVTGALQLTAQTLDALTRPAAPTGGDLVDAVLGVPAVYSLGYLKPTDDFPFGSSGNRAFGTPGNGGSFGFADPDLRLGYGYAPNRLGFGLVDAREIALRDALYCRVLGERPQGLDPGRRRPRGGPLRRPAASPPRSR